MTQHGIKKKARQKRGRENFFPPSASVKRTCNKTLPAIFFSVFYLF
jgi:hypothetical protein